MKKKLFLLVPLMALLMTGCVKYNGQGKNGPKSSVPDSQQSDTSAQTDSSGEVTSDSGSEASQTSQGSEDSNSSQQVNPTPVTGEDLPVGTAVKVYLVFGEYGKYKGNLVNTSIDSLYLEHTMEYAANVGDDLPGVADVTSFVSGSHFVAWTAYNNDGQLTQYTKVPAVHDKILYAYFSGGSGQGGETSNPDSGNTSQPSEETVTITFKVTYDTGMDVGIYLVGDFCEWNPGNNNAIKFEWGEGNVWSATKTAPQGMVYHCKLVTAPYNVPSQVYVWEKDGEGNERVITFSSSTTMNLEWGNY